MEPENGPILQRPNAAVPPNPEQEFVVILHGENFVPESIVKTQPQSSTLVGRITNVDDYMPEHYSYFRGSRKVEII